MTPAVLVVAVAASGAVVGCVAELGVLALILEHELHRRPPEYDASEQEA